MRWRAHGRQLLIAVDVLVVEDENNDVLWAFGRSSGRYSSGSSYIDLLLVTFQRQHPGSKYIQLCRSLRNDFGAKHVIIRWWVRFTEKSTCNTRTREVRRRPCCKLTALWLMASISPTIGYLLGSPSRPGSANPTFTVVSNGESNTTA